MINRRQMGGLLLAAPLVAGGCSDGIPKAVAERGASFSYLPGITTREPLVAPRGRPIRAAFAINPGVQVIDIAGPWETFQDTYVSPDAEAAAFELYTVSETLKPLRGSGGL